MLSSDISETSYKVFIALDVLNHNEDDESGTHRILCCIQHRSLYYLTTASIYLTVSYPPDYPDIPPDLSLSFHSNTYLRFPEDGPLLLSSLEETITESLGQAMIFTLISTLKENTENLIAERQKAVQAEEDKERAKAEEVENAKFHGTAVTRESFLAWRKKFLEELEKIDEDRRKDEEEHMGKKEMARSKEVKLTGKQLWEQGLVGKVDEDEGDGEGERDGLDGMERLKVVA